ncbi:MAG TPA: hypothetical protein DCS93_34050 [Microscillaceae bacterium]|nr:hypothetical protein [Microscillaceae bacterium]
MFHKHSILLGLMAILCLLPLYIKAQQLPAKQYILEVKNYQQFEKDIQSLPPNIKVVDMDQSQHFVTIQTTEVAFKHYLTTNRYIRRYQLNGKWTTLEATQIDHNFNVNKINRLQHEFPNITGEGMLIGIHEPFLDVNDIDLQGRYVETTTPASFIDRHTTNMATLIAGGGNSSTRGRGVAWRATFTSSSNTDTLPESDTYYQNLKLGVQNHSYGIEIQSFYGKQARAFDLSANNNDQLLHVMSIGNSGLAVDSNGTYKLIPGFANITGNFKMAKNILTVGAVDRNEAVTLISSRGPAYDGRIKPELVAFGEGGTSNATAITTGIVALLQQAYKQNNSNQLPSATLLKAILINSADDVDNPQVDYRTGFGNVNAYRAHQGLTQNQFFQGNTTQGNTVNFDLTVPANAQNLKVTLVWNDPAAAENVSQALINDLDLTVTQMSTGTTLLPWVLSTTPDAVALNQTATRGEDHLNNIEQITLADASAGTYRIAVKGLTVTGSQSFYIAYQWDVKGQFTWDFPTGSDNLPYHGELVNFFRWQSSFAAGQTGKLEISVDQGQTWEVVEPSVDLNKGFIEWQEPKDTFALALARMTVGSQVFTTETFTLSTPIRLDIGFNCGDSVMIQWPKIPAVQSYTLLTRGDKYLKTFTQLTDTSIVINKSLVADSLYSVVPNFSSTKSGIMSATVDYNFTGIGCFVSSFFAEPRVDTGIALNLALGTNHEIAQIVYERINNNVYETIGTQSPTGVITDYVFFDEQPFTGQNFYRARIVFKNGSEVISELTSAYYLDQVQFIFFPNPAVRSKPLNVFSRDFQGEPITIKLYNSQGKEVYSEEYTSDRHTINLTNYPSGLYYYRVGTNSVQKTGKIILK